MRFSRTTPTPKRQNLYKQGGLSIKTKKTPEPETIEPISNPDPLGGEPKTIKERVEKRRERLRQETTPQPNTLLKQEIEISPKSDLKSQADFNFIKIKHTAIGFDRIMALLNILPVPKIVLEDFDKKFKGNIPSDKKISIMGLTDLQSIIQNKKIAMIANSPALLNNLYGQEIDTYDIVIRFNSFVIIPEFTGSKTTIHATIHLQDVNLDVYTPIRLVIAPNLPKWLSKVQTISPFKQGTFIGYSNYFEFTPFTLSYKPFTTGFNMFLLLKMIGGFKELKLFGFDLYINDDKSILRSPEETTSQISRAHDYDLERSVLQTAATSSDKNKFNYTFL